MRRKLTALFAALILLFSSCGENRAVEIEISPIEPAITAIAANDSESETFPVASGENKEEFAEAENIPSPPAESVLSEIPETTFDIVTEAVTEETAASKNTANNTVLVADAITSNDSLSSLPEDEAAGELIINHSTGKYHLYSDCPYAAKISEGNRQARRISESAIQKYGYIVCSWCHKHSQDAEEAAQTPPLSEAAEPVSDTLPETTAKQEEITSSPEKIPPSQSPEEAVVAGYAADTSGAAADALNRLAVGNIKVIVNISTGKYHTADCSYSAKIKDENRWEGTVADLAALEALGYVKCEYCRRAETPEQAPQPVVQPEETVPEPSAEENIEKSNKITVILNTSTMCLHISSNCHAAKKIKDENRLVVELDDIQGIYELLAQGYSACGICAKQYKN
ncbi:MAG: hypothetical protein GX897_03305 [Clostridiales bacterium]|nr:hypothetical protein [Clostridiales bacterium]